MVSSIRPETNYSAYLIEALQKLRIRTMTPGVLSVDSGSLSSQVEVFAYCERDEKNKEVPLSNLRLCWDRNWRFFYQILRQAGLDKIDIIHLQHEVNMYGGPRTTAIFPFLILMSRILGFKTVVTVHAAVPVRYFDAEFLKVFEWPAPHLLAPVVRVVFPVIYFLIGIFSSRVIVHTTGLKNTLVKDYFFNPGNISVIPHGIPEDVSYEISAVSPSIKERLGEQRFILYFGYIHRRKGLDVLIKAFGSIQSEYPDLVLVIGGGTILPGYSDELKGLVKRLDIENKVIITGFLNLNDLRYLLDRSQFVVLPAIYSIAASGPLAQVFAHEKPVIVTKIGSYAEEITDGVDGLLVEKGSVESLAIGLRRLMTDDELKRKIVDNVKSKHEARRWLKIAGLTLNIYNSLSQF